MYMCMHVSLSDLCKSMFTWVTGIGSFTIVDGHKVSGEDIGNK